MKQTVQGISRGRGKRQRKKWICRVLERKEKLWYFLALQCNAFTTLRILNVTYVGYFTDFNQI
jgi:hypothetical protein